MRIGVPTEIKKQESRVGLTPESVGDLIDAGHDVFVQKGAGTGSGFADSDYTSVGASIVPDADAVFEAAELIVKVKEPQPEETARLTPNHTLFTYLHLAPDPVQAKGLIASGCTAIAYETVTEPAGGLPLLRPMSQVAGRMSMQVAAWALMRTRRGRGLLLGGVPGVQPAKVVIIGGGVSGTNAAEIAVGMRADVTVFDRNNNRLAELDAQFNGLVKTMYSTKHALAAAVQEADLVIGAVLIPGAAAPKLISREQLKTMKPGAVLVDIAIDQGGCFETSKATTHEDPIYEVDGILHYCVANMPGAVPRTSTYALNNATLPFVLQIANKGTRDALNTNPHLANGLTVAEGHITHEQVARDLGMGFRLPDWFRAQA
ncbi:MULTISPECIES: alanine dehydrogenase [Henriciella]|jgi:alanine dehydrogenase|uniref:Alanine dehydrogenase n=1 Tax=Henriciella pelagia TaxID=1977912 RepID=A0ABQ1JXX9_9PROT|nr:alanine dehydrogenase [Henriciella pelagia]GGB77063.1 alanine dehydrogenase [Henriciella pelagia]